MRDIYTPAMRWEGPSPTLSRQMRILTWQALQVLRIIERGLSSNVVHERAAKPPMT